MSLKKKKKFNFTVELLSSQDQTKHYLKPTHCKILQPKIEEVELNFLSSKVWIPGEKKPEQITFTLYLGDKELDSLTPLYEYVARLFNKGTAITTTDAAICKLTLTNSITNEALEIWELDEVYFSALHFGDEDNEMDITLTYSKIRYISL